MRVVAAKSTPEGVEDLSADVQSHELTGMVDEWSEEPLFFLLESHLPGLQVPLFLLQRVLTGHQGGTQPIQTFRDA